LGGETSGHAICLDKTTTGDGLITALQVLNAMVKSGESLAKMASGMHKMPQLLINVPVTGKAKPILELAAVRAAEKESVQRLGARGRVLLRASGTEPLIRVMVEGEDESETRREAESIAASVRAAVA
jgi:phosphoglucosamine mutase